MKPTKRYLRAKAGPYTGPDAVPDAHCIYVLGGFQLSVEKLDANVWEDFAKMPFQRDVGCVAVPVGQMI